MLRESLLSPSARTQTAQAIRESRKVFGSHFLTEPEQIIFTGGGSEANNLALYGPAMHALTDRQTDRKLPRILYSAIEHPAVWRTAESLKDLGFLVQKIPVGSDAQVDQAALENLLREIKPDEAPPIVSIMSVNNIVGTQLPVVELAKTIRKHQPGAIIHSDCVQAMGKVDLPKAGQGIDLLTLSAHKIEGPKGIGALVILNRNLQKQHLIRPLVWGGGQEEGLRAGTESPGLICAFAKAAEICLEEREKRFRKIAALRDQFEKELRSRDLLVDTPEPGKLVLNTPKSNAVPHIVHFSLIGMPTTPLLKLLEKQQCLVSAGSACSSGKQTEEKVCLEMGLGEERAKSTLRVSLSQKTCEGKLFQLIEAMESSIKTMVEKFGLKTA